MSKFDWLNVALIITISYFTYVIFIKEDPKETFSHANAHDFPSYDQCMATGKYTKSYCELTPGSMFGGTSACRCENGEVGKVLPGSRGECVCDELEDTNLLDGSPPTWSSYYNNGKTGAGKYDDPRYYKGTYNIGSISDSTYSSLYG